MAGSLTVRKVNRRRRLSLEDAILDVANHAYDLSPRGLRIVAADFDEFADRVLSREEAPRETLADHHHRRLVLRIALLQQPAATQRYAHRAEVVGVHVLDVGVAKLTGAHWTVLNAHPVVDFIVAVRHFSRHHSHFYAGNHLESLQRLV